jgi:hypothetical protein
MADGRSSDLGAPEVTSQTFGEWCRVHGFDQETGTYQHDDESIDQRFYDSTSGQVQE